MNAIAAQPARLAVSPYARRLSRERGVPLEQLRGSGPRGRILAADVMGFLAIVEPTAPAALHVAQPAARQTAALATSVSLAALNQLLGLFETAATQFDPEDVILRAALNASAGTHELADARVALEDGKRQHVLAATRQTPPSLVRSERLAALAGTGDDTKSPAGMSVRFVNSSSIRPVMMPLLSGRPMRLVVSADRTAELAECLLVFDPGMVEEDVAISWLGAFRAGIEIPLRLFV